MSLVLGDVFVHLVTSWKVIVVASEVAVGTGDELGNRSVVGEASRLERRLGLLEDLALITCMGESG
jgi:hypothetical protein